MPFRSMVVSVMEPERATRLDDERSRAGVSSPSLVDLASASWRGPTTSLLEMDWLEFVRDGSSRFVFENEALGGVEGLVSSGLSSFLS